MKTLILTLITFTLFSCERQKQEVNFTQPVPVLCVVVDKLQSTATDQEFVINPFSNDPVQMKPNISSSFSILYRELATGEKFTQRVSSDEYLIQQLGDTLSVLK